MAIGFILGFVLGAIYVPVNVVEWILYIILRAIRVPHVWAKKVFAPTKFVDEIAKLNSPRGIGFAFGFFFLVFVAVAVVIFTGTSV